MLRHSLLNEADYTLPVDYKGDPALSVKGLYLSIRICDQRKLETELLAKFLVGFNIVRTDAQDLGVEAFELLEILLESLHLTRSAGTKVFEVKSQYDGFLVQIVNESDCSIG